MYTNKNIRGASLTSPLFLLERKYALNSFNTKRKGVAVTIVETGEKFNSIKACADYIGGNHIRITAKMANTTNVENNSACGICASIKVTFS